MSVLVHGEPTYYIVPCHVLHASIACMYIVLVPDPSTKEEGLLPCCLCNVIVGE